MSIEQLAAGCAVVAFFGTVVITVAGWLLHQKDVNQAQEMAHTKEAFTARLDVQAKAMDRMEDSLRASWARVDELREARGQYWTRDDHERWMKDIKADNAAVRQEFKEDLRDLGTRLEAAIASVSSGFKQEVKAIIARGKLDRTVGDL